MYNTTCSPHHHHDGFMVTGILGHSDLQLYDAAIQKSNIYSSIYLSIYSSNHQSNEHNKYGSDDIGVEVI